MSIKVCCLLFCILDLVFTLENLYHILASHPTITITFVSSFGEPPLDSIPLSLFKELMPSY